MMEEESHVGELVAPYVLGALEPEEVEAVEVHLLTCERCRALVEEERAISQLLPYLAEPVDVPMRARRALLAAIRDEVDPEPDIVSAAQRRIPALVTRLGWFVAASAVVLAMAFGWNGQRMQAQVDQKNSELSLLEARQKTIAEFVGSPRGFVTNLQSTGVVTSAEGGVILDPTRNAALLVVDGLPKPMTGHAYVVWMVRGNEHVNAGILPVDSDGRGQLYITMPEVLASFDGILVTDESGPLAVNPSGTRLMAARVGN